MDSSSTSAAQTPAAEPPATEAPAPEPPKVVKFAKILERGVYAAGMRGVPKNDAFPDQRVVPVWWRCGHKKKNGHTCGKRNAIERTSCRECKGMILDYRNVKQDRDGRPIQAGDELNLVPGRLKAVWWECPLCDAMHDIDDDSVVGICCPNCFQNNDWVTLTDRTWVYNKFAERLGTFDGFEIVELNPWMDSLWAINDRINHNRPYTIVE